jgi:nicotinamide N-methyltransferase
MSLTTRITTVRPAADPEDFLGESLGVIFPDEIMIQHGDADNNLEYNSPHLPKPLDIELADPDEETDRRLFSHYLWNSSLMLAEFVEAGCLELELVRSLGSGRQDRAGEKTFDVRGLETLELGAGTALPSTLAALLGASRVVVTDYPAPPIMEVLRKNVACNTQPGFSPTNSVSPSILVEGHAWGDLETPFALGHKASFDRIFVCDCLWTTWQHANLCRSISWFMKDGDESRAWIVAGFHTGRHSMAGFFEPQLLADAGLEVEHVWERDCDGFEREWEAVRQDDASRKRWLAVGVLRKIRSRTRSD